MLQLQAKPTFWAKCFISIAGQPKPVSIEIEFNYLSKSELKVFWDGIEGKDDIEALTPLVVNWKGVDAEYSEEALAVVLDTYPLAAQAIFEAFSKEVGEAKGKN